MFTSHISMKFGRILAVWLGLLLCVSAHGAATQVRLVMPIETVKPGETITVGVLLETQAGWHTYWKNPGESGAATKIIWTLPAGVTAGDILWPLPERTDSAGLITFVHHGSAMLLVPLSISDKTATGPLELKAKVSWLECEKVCVPGRTEVNGTLQVGTETKASADADLIKQWQAKLPKADAALKVTSAWDGEAKEGKRNLLINITASSDAAAWDFYPYRGEGFDVSPKSEKVSAKDKTFTVRKVVTTDEGKWPTEIKGLIVGGANADQPTVAYEASVVIGGGSNSATTAASSSSKTSDPAGSVVPQQSLGLMLFYAFLGGIILNIMPCVLPVISLKILGFVKQSQQDPQRVKVLGLIYGLGVIVSFVVLAGLVIGVQQAGKVASWGMQFQNAQFLIVLTVLVTLISLNLFGVFEVTAGDNIMGAAGQLATKKGPSGAFFNGVLATVLATPCTAPFLGTALGFAFSQSAAIILLLFVTIGFGLAAPYVVLSFQPNWLKFLPKPGAWMERFKILMGFPMLATAIWLFSLAAGHFGNRGVLWIGLLLVLIGLSAYIFGEFAQRGQKHQGLAKVVALALALVSMGYILEAQLHWRFSERAGNSTATLDSKVGIAWKPWSSAEVMAARKEGHVVFVDFTADWCTTCQWNKKTSIELDSVKQKLSDVNAVALLGDYTYEDPAIANELKKYKRAGVPLVLVFPADPNAEPIVLPEILTPSIVLEALEKAAPKKLTAAQ